MFKCLALKSAKTIYFVPKPFIQSKSTTSKITLEIVCIAITVKEIKAVEKYFNQIQNQKSTKLKFLKL